MAARSLSFTAMLPASLLLVAIALAMPASLSAQEPELTDAQFAAAREEEAQKADAEVEAKAESNWLKYEAQIDEFVGENLVTPLFKVLFFDFWTGPYTEEIENPAGGEPTVVEHPGWLRFGEAKKGTSVPFVVAWLMFGAIFLTLRMRLINLRGFGHALRVTKGDYDDAEDTGEVSHFQALTSALSATVGLGNIAGVAIAVGTGGPGAIVWMIFAGLVGMTSKFAECTLGQMYRRVDKAGRVSGGPMRYLSDGLTDMGLRPLGLFLAALFAVLCIGASFGGGCAFQVGQSMKVVQEQVPWLENNSWAYGLGMAFMVGIVIIGGIRRIAMIASAIVPVMCAIYVAAAFAILAMNAAEIPAAFATIFSEAFNRESAYGGLIGVMVIGIQRAAFSNEAGIGSAPIAHSAAKTKYPVREGIVALLEPFIDTVVICTMTGLVIVITGAYDQVRFPEHAALIEGNQGAVLTSKAFATTFEWFPKVLAVAVVLFAYSTVISWSYYGERCFTYLFGAGSSIIYKLLFLGCVFLGAVVSATNVLDFSDLMILSMALPNILGLLLLSKKVRLALQDYWVAYKLGDFRVVEK